jgi:choline dehydrogenase-like flavoprotein
MPPRVAIAGSGIVAALMADALTRQGCEVDVFEKGDDYPYPHMPQFSNQVHYLQGDVPWRAPEDIRSLEFEGDYLPDLNGERIMWNGGMATRWEAMTLRFREADFAPGVTFGSAVPNWPITYAEIEPYYGLAEQALSVSGTDDDNPFAPPRSTPYPLPPFDLAADDLPLRERLSAAGIVLHTTPQARTRLAADGRPGCMNFGTCSVCPIGARYSPAHHLMKAIATGRCRVHVKHSVRRILTRGQNVTAFLVQARDEAQPREVSADVFVVAAGCIESARLLLVSRSQEFPHGVGNAGDQVGQHFLMHHIWQGQLRYSAALYPGRFGGWTAQTHQFCAPGPRGAHGGVKVELPSQPSRLRLFYQVSPDTTPEQIVGDLQDLAHTRWCGMHSESLPSPGNRITLASTTDRHGDPFAMVHYRAGSFNEATYAYAKTVFERVAKASGAVSWQLSPYERYESGYHHLGGCRMGTSARDSVVDGWCRVHGMPNLFVIGGSNFVSTSSVNPTLTIAALALRAAGRIVGPAAT